MPDPQPFPTSFGRYVLRERVGKGGMAEVFRASQPGFGGFDKIVAIKRMFREYGHDAGFVQMLTDEAKIVSQLVHPNIVQILDLGREGDDYYIAFEYIDGVDLFAVLQRHHETARELPLGLACYVVAELCAALDHAHSRRSASGAPLGIVHRDVSPQNVLLSMHGEVKLADFGIAKAAHRFTETQAGLIKGKIYYMSPEQVLGQAIDHRADLFAAGILLFEVLTTQPLYDELDQRRLIDIVSRAQFTWPEAKVNRAPAPLRAIVERALRPNPAERFQAGRELRAAITAATRDLGLHGDRDALGAYVRGMYGIELDRPPTVASRVARPERDERWNSQHRMPLPGQDGSDDPTLRAPAMPPRLPVAKVAPVRSSAPIQPAITEVPLAPRAAGSETIPPPSADAPFRPAPPRPLQRPASARPASSPGIPPPLPHAALAADPPPVPREPIDPPTDPIVTRTTARQAADPAASTVAPPSPAPAPPVAGGDGGARPIAPASSPSSLIAATTNPSKPGARRQPAPPRPSVLISGRPPSPAGPGVPAGLASGTPAPARAPSSAVPVQSVRPPPLSAARTPPPSAVHEEATREFDQAEMARRLGLAEAAAERIDQGATQTLPAFDDADLDDTTRPQRGQRRAAPAPALVPVGEAPDPDDLPATPLLLAATAAVWVMAVVLAVYATLVTVRRG